jgi:polyhydroxyalkanoate synthesis regulator protein
MEIIYKYKNRKMYSTHLSKYVTLEYLVDLVTNNNKFIVLDHVTKHDVTSKVLVESLLKLNPSTRDLEVLIKRSIRDEK